MFILYHCMSARSFRVLWALEELALPYQLKMLPFPPRVLAKDYLAINPLGTIPALIDGDMLMTESAAICQYLATKYGPTPLAVRLDEPDYGLFLNWLYFGEATLTFPQTIVLRYGQLEPEERRLPQAVEDYSRWFLGRLRKVEDALARSQFLCAGRFTVADISVGYACMLAMQIGLGDRLTSNVCDYWGRLQTRDAFKRALDTQEREAAAQNVAAPRLRAAR